MPDHLRVDQREQLLASVRTTCDYLCEFAEDAMLFLLLGELARYAGNVAQRLNEQHYMSPPSMPDDRAMAEQVRMQPAMTPANHL